MTVKLYEGDKTETGGAGIEITDNKVVNLKLREENNLIEINEDDEAYVDLQLADGIAPDDDFPVGVTTGRVLVADGRPVAGTVTISKTTSGDYTIYLYGDDGRVYVDNGTGERHIVSFGYEAGEGISIDTGYSNARTRKFGDFHIPTSAEWETLIDWTITNYDYAQYLKIPLGGGSLSVSDGSHLNRSNSHLWCSDVHGTDACLFDCGASSSSVSYSSRIAGCSLRLFADTPVIPDETWTLLGTRNSAKIYRNETLGLITVANTSLGGTTYITLKDKNEGATEVYVVNGGVGPTTANNCGYFYQRGNCHGFPWTGATDTSATKVDASGYGPYKYEGSTFITGNGDWSSVQNDNLWAYEVPTEETQYITNTGVLSVDGQTGHVTLGLGTAAYANIGTGEGNVPVLDANGRLDPTMVPSTGVMNTFTVTNKSDLTTITNAVKGDIAIVTSENKTYILSEDPYSTLSNWTELLFPTGSVSSVNGFTGAVNLTTGYIQESGDNLFVSTTEKNVWNNKLGTNNVSTVALTGNYADLNSKPVIDTAMNSSSTNAVQNKVIKAYVDTTAGSSAAGVISDTAYGSSWDGDTTHAPSKNAVYDELNSIEGDVSTLNTNVTNLQSNSNTKTFFISSTSDLTNAQAAYDWAADGNNAILVYNNRAYMFERINAGNYVFRSVNATTKTSGNHSEIINYTLTLSINGTTVETILASDAELYLLTTNINYSTAYTPIWDGSPATKKYVDDNITALGGLKFQVITQSAYTALNGTYEANTVYLIKQG